MKRFLGCISILWGIGVGVSSGQHTPHLSGTVSVSIRKQTLTCSWEYTQLPEHYALRLNHLMHPRVEDTQGQALRYRRWKDHDTGDARAYQLVADSLPDTVRIAYQLRMPLWARIRSKWSDWKGNVAFNDHSLRVTEQTEWYPVLYDSAQQQWQQEVAYEITVVCEDCTGLFLNGSLPVSGSQATFTRDTPVQLMLFVGDFEVVEREGVSFINTGLSDVQQQALVALVEEVGAYYAQNLQIPYGTELAFIQASPTQKGRSWGFNSYPAIVTVGNPPHTLQQFFDESGTIKPKIKDYLFHEAGHYYFGNYRQPRGPLRWALLEGFNDYIALCATRALLGDSAREFDNSMMYYREQVDGKAMVALADVVAPEQITSLYRYRMIPLMLLAIEQRIGEEAMWAWLRAILATPNSESVDVDFLVRTLRVSGLPEVQVNGIERDIFRGEDWQSKVLDAIRQD